MTFLSVFFDWPRLALFMALWGALLFALFPRPPRARMRGRLGRPPVREAHHRRGPWHWRGIA